MKNRLLAALLVCCVPLISQAQLDDFGDVPVQITADGETRFEGGVAVAEQNVIIEYGDTHILADYAQYSPETREVLLRGHVRIYRSDFNFTGERAVYNLETKKLRAADFGGAAEPFYFSGESVTSLTSRAFQVRNALFTTHDSAQPDYHFRARSVRIYRDDRIIFSNVTLFVGQTPVFWWPYLYQSLREDMSFTLTPGYNSRWGAFLLTQFTFPVAENVAGRIRLDLRSERGVAGGLDLDYRFGKDNRSYGSFQAYFAGDSGSDINKTGLKREDVDSGRYRISLQQRTYVTDDIYANFDINALSDRRMLEDFFPSEFTLDPQPDNVISVVKTHENYTITLLTRAQVNDFQDTTERLPELVADFKRQNLFGSDIFYEGETGAAFLRRRFGDGDENVRFLSTGTTRPTRSEVGDYDTIRLDTLHQFLYPKTYFGWLSLIPRIGFRATYYGDTGRIVDEKLSEVDDLAMEGGEELSEPNEEIVRKLIHGGSKTRVAAIAGVEASFKFSKTWEDAQNRAWGLDGLRHIVQPYTNFSWVSDPGADPLDILQFDRRLPTTQPQPIDVPLFVSTDSLDQWTIWRLGVRNRLQTRRDDANFNWMKLDTFIDVNFDNPYDSNDFSNLVNRFSFRPLPWVSLDIDSQLPVLDSGFTELNSSLRFMPHRSMEFRIGHRYLDNNDYFDNSNLITFGGYVRLNENWGFGFYEQYEAEDSVLETQRYAIYRDLTSWVASLGAIIRDNRGEDEFGLILTFTLKDFPQVNIPFNLDPEGFTGGE